MLEKNSVHGMEATDLTIDGMGIGRIDGVAVFAADMLPGERGRVKIIKTAKKYAVARLLERTETSPQRRTPLCPAFPQCGGCTLIHLDYFGHVSYKVRRVRHALEKAAPEAQISFPLPSPTALRYRNKTAFPVTRGEDGEIRIGCYARRSHNVVDTPRCLLQSAAADRCVNAVRRWMEENHIEPYDEATHTGLVRHVVVRKTQFDDVMVGIAINGKEAPAERELVRALREAEEDVISIAINENTQRGNTILGENTRVIFGAPALREVIGGLEFDISLNAFLQVNHGAMELLYHTAMRLAGIRPGDIVADLYCGAGTITLTAARLAKKAYGVEAVPQAIENARSNARLNDIDNAEFLCGDSAAGFAEILKKEGRIDIVIVDPPRRGLTEDVIRQIAGCGARRVVYVSCDPATLARDLAALGEEGYAAEMVQPVDMFPQTTHVECVVGMGRHRDANQ